MSFDVLGDLNWLAVIVATLAFFILGGIWYAEPVFGRAWLRSSGVRIPQGQRPSAKFYVGPLVTCALASIATAMLARATGSDGVADGIVLGLVVAVGYVLTTGALSGLFDQRPEPRTWFLIFGGYQLVGLMLVSIIVTVWD